MSNLLNKASNLQNKMELFYKKYNSQEKILQDGCLIELFEKSVEANSNKTAVCNGEVSITYKALNEEANKMARYLQKKGVRENDFVLIQAGRNIQTVVGILAVLKTGAAYIPIDENYPKERQEYIKEDSQCKYVIEKEEFLAYKKEDYDAGNLSINYHKESLAYVIYTSGSTGKPKGVAIENRSALNTIADMLDKFKLTDMDKVLGISSYSFDLSVFDLFATFISGACLYQVEDARNMNMLKQIVTEKNITIWNSVPVLMELYIDCLSTDYRNTDMKYIFLSGDWIPVTLPEKLKSTFPNATVVSLGGATEASIWSVFYEIKQVFPEDKSIPYGIPLANQSLYILNYDKKLCPCGTQGEIYIGGKGLARCYLNDVEKTRESFIEHELYGRLYRTGDYGIMHKEGYIEFCGRKDDQVKVNGFRIEIGEIETCLNRDFSVKQSAVVIQKNDDVNRIIAFIVPKEKMLSESYYKNMIMRILPDYMVPATFVETAEIPLNVNGKVDRKKLLESLGKKMNEFNYESPATQTEKRLAVIIESVLKNGQKVGRFDNFYTMSINSIMMMEIINKVQEEFGFKVNFRDFIKVSNLMELAEYVDKVIEEKGPESTAHTVRPDNHKIPKENIQNKNGIKNAYEMFQLSKNMYRKHICFANENMSYEDADEKIKKYGEQIAKYDLKIGSCIALVFTGKPEEIIAFLAIVKKGFNPVVLGSTLSETEKKVIKRQNLCELYFEGGTFYKKSVEESDREKNESYYSCYEKEKSGVVVKKLVTKQELYQYISGYLSEKHISDAECRQILLNDTLESIIKTTMVLLSTGAAVKYSYEVVKKEKESVGECLFWSPALQWKIQNDTLYVGGKYYKELPKEVFPELYYLSQEGIEKEALVEFLKRYIVDSYQVECVVELLIENHILVDSILPIDEVFMSQGKLMQHKYGEQLIYDADAYHKFKNTQLERCTYTGEDIKLPFVPYNLPFEQRHSVRVFDEAEQIPFSVLAQWISSVKQKRINHAVHYSYASAGGFYPIDIYLNIKENRVQDLDGGLYYFNPIKNSIIKISEDGLTTDIYFYTNREIFDASAVSVLLVYNASVSMPRYQYMGYYYACIDCGLLISTLTEAGQVLNLGSCSIGDFDFKKASQKLHLGKNEILLHIVEFGLNKTSEKTVFYNQVCKNIKY